MAAFIIATVVSLLVAANAMSVEQQKHLTKRSRACEDLAKAVVDMLNVADNLHPETAQMVEAGVQMFEYKYQIDPTDQTELSRFVCQFEDAESVDEIADIMGIPPRYFQSEYREAKQMWERIGQADGIEQLSEPFLRGVKAFSQMNVFRFSK